MRAFRNTTRVCVRVCVCKISTLVLECMAYTLFLDNCFQANAALLKENASLRKRLNAADKLDKVRGHF